MGSKPTALFVVFLVAFSLVAFVLLSNAASNTSDYTLVQKVILGGEGGWDYFDVDPTTGHIFIPRGEHILVVDSRGKQLADIDKAHDTHAIVFAPEFKSAFLSAGGSVDVLDTEKMQVVGRIDLSGKDPDAILYDATTNRVFTFNGGGTNDATAIDISTAKVVGSVLLGGKPEFARTDGDGHIYVNIEDKNQVVAFDSKTLKVLHTWPIAPCKEPSGLAIDVEHKRLFAGCHNQLMAVVDYTNGKVVATVPIGKGVDANRFDPTTGLAFASCGDGTITVALRTRPINTPWSKRSRRSAAPEPWLSTPKTTMYIP